MPLKQDKFTWEVNLHETCSQRIHLDEIKLSLAHVFCFCQKKELDLCIIQEQV